MAENDCLSAAPRKPCSLGPTSTTEWFFTTSVAVAHMTPIWRNKDGTHRIFIRQRENLALIYVPVIIVRRPTKFVHGLLLDNSIHHDCMVCGSAMMNGADTRTAVSPWGPRFSRPSNNLGWGNAPIAISQLLSSCCYIFTVSNSNQIKFILKHKIWKKQNRWKQEVNQMRTTNKN